MSSETKKKVLYSDAEWRAKLTPLQYEVTRNAATERAFTGIYYDNKAKGTYKCICCGTALFTSETKYDSGCGWPSFFDSIEDARIIKREDNSYGMRRVEIVCAECDAHLGHVFPDGPRDKGGLRFCVNSASLDFEGSDDA